MTAKRILIAATIALVVVVAAAWAVQYFVGRATRAEKVYHVSVTRDGRTLGTFTVEELTALGTKRVFMQGQYETGPPVLAVLRAARVGSFEGVRFRGLGVRDSGKLTLARAAMSPNVLLDVAKRGTVKVCGPAIPWEKRVRDVVEISVY